VYAWAVAERDNDRLIGTTTLFSLAGAHRRAEIGYSLVGSHQGRGLAAEALRTAIGHAFGDLGLERIEADVDPRNEKSWQLLERLGFRREGLLRDRWRVDGEVCDSYLYGLLRPEYVAG
jgi:RimJ/RimL family protein N-acetyltransferase